MKYCLTQCNDIPKTINVRMSGTTPLMAAAMKGHTEIVVLLVDLWLADLDDDGKGGNKLEVSPLWCAAAYGHVNIVKLLITKSVDVNRYNLTTGSTALYTACSNGYLDIVKILVEKGANIEWSNCDGVACLMAACLNKREKIARYMLTQGAIVYRTSIKCECYYYY